MLELAKPTTAQYFNRASTGQISVAPALPKADKANKPMYCQFYGLAEQPFNLTPDSKFLFLSKRHQEALAALLYGVRERKGFICLSGEIGSGKTTLYRTLHAQLDHDRIKTAVILNSYLSDLELLKTINEEYGLPADSSSKKELLDKLNYFLVEQFRKGNNCVLILDEAQNLRPETLEQIRMISNLETETDKLIQIIMVGQPQLQQTLALPELEQLNQRITVRHHVTPLSEEEVGEYIRHRLRVAKSQVNIEWTPQALRLIYHYSKGIPRKINVICDRCLLLGYVTSRFDIDGDMVQQAVNEVRGELQLEDETISATAAPAKKAPSALWRVLGQGLLGVGALAIVAAGVWLGATLKDVTSEKARAASERERQIALDSPSSAQSPDKESPAKIKSPEGKSNPKILASAQTNPPTARAAPEEKKGNAASDPKPAADPATPAAVAPFATPAPPEPTASPTPKPTPLPPNPWEYDSDRVVRVERREHAAAAAHISLIRAWGIEVELSTFAQAPPEKVTQWDLTEMIKQLHFFVFKTPDLTEALKLDLPLLIQFDPDAKDFPPCAALLRTQGDLFTLADPIKGLRTVKRKELLAAVRELSVLYRDPDQLTGLRTGTQGEAVAQLQRVLLQDGQKIKEIDGKFGSKMLDALQAFQEKYHLPQTNSVDPLTAAFISTLRESGRPRLYS